MNISTPFSPSKPWTNPPDFRSSSESVALSESFKLTVNEANENIIHSQEMGLCIKVRKDGYIPKSGLLVAEQLRKIDIKGKAIDIGTGESGILAHCLLTLGASEVFASDVDETVLSNARTCSSLSANIHWRLCSLFPKSERGLFDFIVSNPPQMPMSYEGHPHDYGGADGRALIEKLLIQTKTRLSQKGTLVLLCFDFLGIDQRTNDRPTLLELADDIGLRTTILSRHKRTIRKGGKTEENIGWINKMYPRYTFLQNETGEHFHDVVILSMNR